MTQKKNPATPSKSAAPEKRGAKPGKRKAATFVIIGATVVVLIGVAVVTQMTRGGGSSSADAAPPGLAASPASPASSIAQPVIAQPVVAAQASAPVKTPPRPAPGAPHGPGFDMPPLQLGNLVPVRPEDVVRDVYTFAADHPEVLKYVPCFCGCGASGHKGNDDCFVGARDAEGRVAEWEPHGAVCTVCIDVGRQAMQMYHSGASVSAIRTAVENSYKAQLQHMTPTPAPPGH